MLTQLTQNSAESLLITKKMKRTRKPHSTSALLNRILKAVLLMFFCVASAGSGVVYMRHEFTVAANNVKTIEVSTVIEERRYARLGAELSEAMATNRLVEKNDQFALGLVIPRDHQIVRVSADVDQRLSNKASLGLLSSTNF